MLTFNRQVKKLAVTVFLFLLGYGILSVVHAVEVKGFLRAQFGDSEVIVREAIKKDFGRRQEIKSLPEDLITGTRTLEIKLTHLKPIKVPAIISYIFGYKCKCLIQVSIVWQLPKNINPQERNRFLTKISSIAQDFAKQSWDSGEVIMGRVSGEIKEKQITNYFFFRGVASDKSAITVWGSPVIIVKDKANSKQNPGEIGLTANIDELQTLGVNYELNVKRPDLKRVSAKNI